MKRLAYTIFAFFSFLILFGGTVSAAGGIEIKKNCAWGYPGRESSVWKSENALEALGVPQEVISSLVKRIERKEFDGWVNISPKNGTVRNYNNGAIEKFTMKGMVFGKSKVCFNVTPSWHDTNKIEKARLYVEQDLNGNLIYIAVPVICNNITRLSLIPKEGLITIAIFRNNAESWNDILTDIDGSPAVDSDGNPITVGSAQESDWF